MRAFEVVSSQQRRWADERGSHADARGYLPTLAENLFAPLSARALQEFGAGAGKELEDKMNEPAKMRALHSSSALVCNVFDHLRSTDPAAVSRVLGVTEPVKDVRLEAELRTGLRGIPPTLDVLLVGSDGWARGVESKFTEPYQHYQRDVAFAGSYFAGGRELWAAYGLPGCQRLAEAMTAGEIGYRHLDAAQLLKHVLGLRKYYSKSELMLLWYQVDAPESEALAGEIEDFARRVDPELGFRAITYQEVFDRLCHDPAADAAHLEYLRSRYFTPAGFA